jgi:hypothetical protein
MLPFCIGLAPCSVQGAPLERGTAIIDPLALRELDLRERWSASPALLGVGLNRMLDPSASDSAPMTNGKLFALPSMAPIRKSLDDEYERYAATRNAASPSESIGVGPSHDLQLFDRELMYSSQTRFVLAGVVNRMDRAYAAPENCGETRLIYRLTRIAGVLPPPSQQGGGESASSAVTPVSQPEAVVSPRLPMTLNIVLKAKADADATSCGEIARRWLAIADLPQGGAELAIKLMSQGGPLELIRPENIDRIETNLQIAHAPKSAVRDFRTDYLMKVFHYDPQARIYQEAPLENQFDRERILSDPAFGQQFKAWLLEPDHLGELDRGTVLIPDKFLKTSAIAPTPAGFVRSDLQPAFGLVEGEGANQPLFAQDDVVAALKAAAEHGVDLRNIRSPGGFERRLNDITCAGCHQSRGIGGFHFPGVDWMAANPSNSTVVPASPHFFGDQVRRRDIVTAFADGRPPDFSRGFSDRPQLRGTKELDGTEYSDGWGAHCYQHQTGAQTDSGDDDRSFSAWNCAEGLACEVTGAAVKSSHMGMCFVKSR